jgi:hypothetical protein
MHIFTAIRIEREETKCQGDSVLPNVNVDDHASVSTRQKRRAIVAAQTGVAVVDNEVRHYDTEYRVRQLSHGNSPDTSVHAHGENGVTGHNLTKCETEPTVSAMNEKSMEKM